MKRLKFLGTSAWYMLRYQLGWKDAQKLAVLTILMRGIYAARDRGLLK